MEQGSKRRRLRAPSPAMLVACIALFVALGGTSYAAIVLPANSVGTKQIKNNAVTAAKIKNATLTGAKIKNATLTGTKIADGAVTGAKIVDGTLEKFKDEVVLLRQKYIRDEAITVEQLVNQSVASLHENIVIRRFVRWQLGEESSSEI